MLPKSPPNFSNFLPVTERRLSISLHATVGLKMSETIKINDRKITTYFWYLWTFLTLPQVSYFWYVFGFQVALQSFSLKVGILSWNLLWTILLCKKSTLQAWEAILCPKNVQKSQKLEIKNYINVLKKIENDLKNELNPQWMACTISEYLKIHKIWPILDF